MKRAIALARRGIGRVEPNPPVGCVLTKNGRKVSEGYHRRYGGPHAEVEALTRAGSAARGAAAYVTLEPCCHTGKTPPCTRALIEAGVKRVVIGCLDPHGTAGGGKTVLRRAGVKVDVGVENDACRDLIAPFIKYVEQGLPYVTLKWAQTIDGAIATHTGDSRWISGEQSRKLVHQRRACADAVMVGIGTALADDPQLTARNVPIRRVARRVVIDPRFRLPLKSKLIATLDTAPLTLAVTRAALARHTRKAAQMKEMGVELFKLPDRRNKQGQVPLLSLLKHIRNRFQATNVLVEGGAGLNGSLLRQGLADELWVFTGPGLLGDGLGQPAVGAGPKKRAVTAMRDAQSWLLSELKRCGDDTIAVYRR